MTLCTRRKFEVTINTTCNLYYLVKPLSPNKGEQNIVYFEASQYK